MKKKKPICKYCCGTVQLLNTSNHIIGCNLEYIAQVLSYRNFEKEANELREIAAWIK